MTLASTGRSKSQSGPRRSQTTWMSSWRKPYMKKKTPRHESIVKDLKSTETIVRGGVMKLSGTMPVLRLSQVGRLITNGPKKLHRNPNPQWHQGCNGVVPAAGSLLCDVKSRRRLSVKGQRYHGSHDFLRVSWQPNKVQYCFNVFFRPQARYRLSISRPPVENSTQFSGDLVLVNEMGHIS